MFLCVQTEKRTENNKQTLSEVTEIVNPINLKILVLLKRKYHHLLTAYLNNFNYLNGHFPTDKLF